MEPLLEPILVVLALVVLATPFATVFLLWRQHKLRQQLLKLTELSMEVTDGLRRDLLDLKRQVEAPVGVPRPAADATSSVHAAPQPHVERTTAPAAVTSEATRPAVKVPVTPDVAAEKKEKEKEPSVPVTLPVVAAKSELAAAEKPAAPAEPIHKPEEKPAPFRIVPPTVPTVEHKPSVAPKQPVHGQKPEPVSPVASTPVKPSQPAVTPPKPPATIPTPPPVAHPPVIHTTAARVVEPPPYAAFRSPAPVAARTTPATSAASKTTFEKRMKSVSAFEELLGTRWLNRIGIVLIVIGVAWLGIKALVQLGPWGRDVFTYGISFALLGAGIFFEKRDRYRIFSYAFIGGGWALLFFTTYALYHVRPMHVVDSETFDLILMLTVAVSMVVHTLRYRSQVVTGLAFLLGYTTVALSHDDVYSLSAGVILAIGLVAIALRMGWFELEIFGILSSYGNHIFWLYNILGIGGAQGRAFPGPEGASEYHASTAILFFYWIIYRISYVVRKTKSPFEEHLSSAAAVINTVLLLGTMKYQSVHPELAFRALLIIGAAEFIFGQIPITRRRREPFIVLSLLGAALMLGAFPVKYSGHELAILWLIGAEVFLIAGVMVSEVVFRRVGLFAGLLVALHLVFVDFQELMIRRRVNEELVLDLGVMFSLCAAVFYLNKLFVGWRWKQFFDDVPDEPLLTIHSYVGGFAAACAAWALCSGDWTAVALAGIMLALAVLGRQIKSCHLQVQYGAIGLLSLARVAVVNLHSDLPQYTHITNRLITLPILAAAFYITAKFATTEETDNRQTLRWLFAFAGTGLLTALIYFEVPELWQPLAAIAFAVALLEIGQSIKYPALAWHAHLLSGLAVLAAVTADPSGVQRWHTIPWHAIGALPVVAGIYWNARRIRVADNGHVQAARIVLSWAGSGMMAWVLYEATPAPWIAVSWIAFAIALALVMRRIGYAQLAWQANAVAACAVVRAFTYNLDLQQPLWPGFSLRLVTISVVAAGLYFLSRAAMVSGSESRRIVSYLHTFAATGLLSFLAWRETPGWLPAVWAIFALVLALVDRRFEMEDLRWQAHILSALAMIRAMGVTIYETNTWHGISIRLLSLSIVAVIFYAMSRIIRMPEKLRASDFHHIYSWAASTLVSMLIWYELKSLSVAVGWAVFGLVLFEYGLWRKVRQFRFQSYIALAAAFGRIFFVNLTAETPGEFWGPRVYTVLPIALILFFVYAQLGEDSAKDDRFLRFDTLLAYLGTGTVAALLYFQFAGEWIVTALAVLVFVLFGLSLLLDRPLFLHQALLLTVGTCVRGVMHNLFGASYFSSGNWTGRFFVLGSAIAALFACLPFAFRWRERFKAQPSGNWIGAIVRRPEQFMFFAPVFLLTLMLAVKMQAGMITVSWGLEALAILIFAFTINERSFRLTGLALLMVSFGKMLLVDMWWGAWTWTDRITTFVIVGVAMVAASFLYTRYRERIRQYL